MAGRPHPIVGLNDSSPGTIPQTFKAAVGEVCRSLGTEQYRYYILALPIRRRKKDMMFRCTCKKYCESYLIKPALLACAVLTLTV